MEDQYLINLNSILSTFSEKNQSHWGAHISGHY